MVLRTCRSVVRDHHAAEDATQATFLALARQAGAVGRRGTVAGWLYQVARRISLRMSGRGRSIRVFPEQDIDRLPASSTAADSIADPDLCRVLYDELERLPDKLRVPLLLCFFEGLTHAEAARRLGWPIGTVATRVARGRERLFKRFLRRGIAISTASLGTLMADESASAISPSFAGATAKAAAAYVVCGNAPGVSENVLGLTKGVIRAMTIKKIQFAGTLLAIGGMLTIGGGWAVGQRPGSGNGPGAGGSPEKPEVRPPAVERPNPGADRLANATQRRRSRNNLKQILLAIHNYEAANGYLPADIRDNDGKALLSWRVLLLPYLEQLQLYNQFKLNEPWDSENNLKLLSKMPDIFRVGFEDKDSSHTYYQAFAGPGTPLHPMPVPGSNAGGGKLGGTGLTGPGGGGPGPGIGTGGGSSTATPNGQPAQANSPPRVRFADVTDGTSNTFGVIETGPPVPWTKPADIPYDPKKPLPKLAGPFADVLNVALLDGSTYSLRRNIDPKVLRIFIGMNDGEIPPDLNNMRASTQAETPEEKAELENLVRENQKLVDEIQQLMKEHTDLLALQTHIEKDPSKAEDLRDRLKQIAEQMRLKNKQMRDNLGLRPGGPVPKPSDVEK